MANTIPIEAPGVHAVGLAVALRSAAKLENVDNTSDADKPVSTAVQTALAEIGPNQIYPGRDYSLPSDLGIGSAAAINGAMAACAAAGGGTVYLPAADMVVDGIIDNKYARVLLKGGCGRDSYHSGGGPAYGTRIFAGFAGTILKHRTPYASELGSAIAKNTGGGFEDISVFGNSQGTRLLEVDSVSYGTYDLYLHECVGSEAAFFTAGVSNTDVAEAADVQKMRCRLSIKQTASGAARLCDGVVFSGSTNANISLNDNIEIDMMHYDGAAFKGIGGDNNTIFLRAFRVPGGTGKLVDAKGKTASHYGFSDNLFVHLTGQGDITAEGTDTADVTEGVTNVILGLDTGNATPMPTSGTGSYWRVETLELIRRGGAELGLVVAGSVSSGKAELANLGTESLRIRNGSSNHIVITDGTNIWGLNISSGNLRISRVAGSGYVDIPHRLATVTLDLTDGIPAPSVNSGKAGLYIDNADQKLKLKRADGTIQVIAIVP